MYNEQDEKLLAACVEGDCVEAQKYLDATNHDACAYNASQLGHLYIIVLLSPWINIWDDILWNATVFNHVDIVEYAKNCGARNFKLCHIAIDSKDLSKLPRWK